MSYIESGGPRGNWSYAQKSGSVDLWKPSGKRQPQETETKTGTKSVSQMKPKTYANAWDTSTPSKMGVTTTSLDTDVDTTKKKMIPDVDFGANFGGSFGG